MAQKPIRLEDDMYDATAHIAKLEHRSHANQVNYMLTLALSFYDDLQRMDREEKQKVKEYIVQEGRDLGILPPKKNTSEPSGSGVSGVSGVSDVSDLLRPDLPDAKDILRANMEQPCCLNEIQPCKHWVWDAQTGDGYKNTLSGRVMEVE